MEAVLTARLRPSAVTTAEAAAMITDPRLDQLNFVLIFVIQDYATFANYKTIMSSDPSYATYNKYCLRTASVSNAINILVPELPSVTQWW